MSGERKTPSGEPEPQITRKVSIGRMDSASKQAEQKKSCCAPCNACYNDWTRTRCGSAVSREYSFLFNFLFAHLLFWAIAFPVVLDYGYENDISGGQEPHGSQGSGVFIIALVLVIVATALFMFRFIRNMIDGPEKTVAEMITEQMTRRNTLDKKTTKARPTQA